MAPGGHYGSGLVWRQVRIERRSQFAIAADSAVSRKLFASSGPELLFQHFLRSALRLSAARRILY